MLGADSSLSEQMEAMKAAVDDIMIKCGQITEDAMEAGVSSQNAKIDIEEAEKVSSHTYIWQYWCEFVFYMFCYQH